MGFRVGDIVFDEWDDTVGEIEKIDYDRHNHLQVWAWWLDIATGSPAFNRLMQTDMVDRLHLLHPRTDLLCSCGAPVNDEGDYLCQECRARL